MSVQIKDVKHPLLHGCHGTSQARCEQLGKNQDLNQLGK